MIINVLFMIKEMKNNRKHFSPFPPPPTLFLLFVIFMHFSKNTKKSPPPLKEKTIQHSEKKGFKSFETLSFRKPEYLIKKRSCRYTFELHIGSRYTIETFKMKTYSKRKLFSTTFSRNKKLDPSFSYLNELIPVLISLRTSS